jgi:hypothetical protein
MSDPLSQEPTRLLDDPELDLGLRHDLEIASKHAPLNYSVDAGLARFEQAIHGATTVPAGGSISGLRVLGWFLGAVALIGGAGYLIAEGRGTATSHDAVAQVASAATTIRTEEEPVAVPRSSDARELPSGPLARESVGEAGMRDGAGDAGPASTQAEGGSPTLDAPVPPRPASKPSTKSVAEAADPAASLADEAAQINAARKALASDPGKALALMEAAEQQFPDGAMIQERRGYTILALVALGRDDDAEALAGAYLQRWPNGPLSRRVRDALER